MGDSLGSRLKHAWNAFFNKDPTNYHGAGSSYSYRPDRQRYPRGSERTIVNSIYNRIALDVASIKFEHIRLDDNNRYLETINSGLNECLNVEANLDQTAKALIQDIVISMCQEGVVAVVPTDTSLDPRTSNSYEIGKMRVGKILEWKPKHVLVHLYDENSGQHKDIWLPKHMVAIMENPFYAIMNEPNSTMQRLIRKLSLMDSIDEQTSSGKLDLIVQLPYTIKTETRKKQAEDRRKDIEAQLTGSKYGIAYTDGTERITQLNRPIENNLLKQIEYLTNLAFSQLGMTQGVLDGTADEKTMLNYNNRIVAVFASAIVDEFKRKFLTKTARTQKQSIMFFIDPFKLVQISNLAEIADKLTRNEVATSNEMRQVIGWKPSKDPKADELRNSNISAPNEVPNQTPTSEINDGLPIDL